MVRRLIIAPADETGSRGEDLQGLPSAADRGGVRGCRPFELAEGADGDDAGLALDGNIDAHAWDRALRAGMEKIAEKCVAEIAGAGYLTPEEAPDILDSYRIYLADLEPEEPILDILAFAASIRVGANDEKEAAEIRKLSQIVSLGFGQKVPHCPFIQLTETPIALYQGYPVLLEICRLLMCPVVQAHETDFVTLASVNPHTAALAGRIVTGLLEGETGRRPFVFLLTTDSSAWHWLREKHFKR